MPDQSSKMDTVEEATRKMREFVENTKPSKEAQDELDDFKKRITSETTGFARVDARIDELEKRMFAQEQTIRVLDAELNVTKQRVFNGD